MVDWGAPGRSTSQIDREVSSARLGHCWDRFAARGPAAEALLEGTHYRRGDVAHHDEGGVRRPELLLVEAPEVLDGEGGQAIRVARLRHAVAVLGAEDRLLQRPRGMIPGTSRAWSSRVSACFRSRSSSRSEKSGWRATSAISDRACSRAVPPERGDRRW